MDLDGLKDLRFSRVLFTNEEDGSPKFFSTINADTGVLEYIIGRGGGILVKDTDDGPGATSTVVKICDDHREDLIKDKGFMPMSFIKRCILRNQFFDPKSYRRQVLEISSKVRSTDNSAGIQGDYDMPSTPASVAGLPQGRLRYTENEDVSIIEFIDKRNSYNRIRGRNLWQSMERDKVTNHTAGSMRSRFLRIILPDIDNYQIPVAWKKRFRGGRSWEDDESAVEQGETSEELCDENQRLPNGNRSDRDTLWQSKKTKKATLETGTSPITKDHHGLSQQKSGQLSIPALLNRRTTNRILKGAVKDSTIGGESSDEQEVDASPELFMDYKPSPLKSARMNNGAKKFSTVIKCFGPDEGKPIRSFMSHNVSPMKMARRLTTKSRVAPLQLTKEVLVANVSESDNSVSSIVPYEREQGEKSDERGVHKLKSLTISSGTQLRPQSSLLSPSNNSSGSSYYTAPSLASIHSHLGGDCEKSKGEGGVNVPSSERGLEENLARSKVGKRKSVNPEEPSTSRACDDGHNEDSSEECASKEVTRRRVKAVMRHYNIGVVEAVDKMRKNQNRLWTIIP